MDSKQSVPNFISFLETKYEYSSDYRYSLKSALDRVPQGAEDMGGGEDIEDKIYQQWREAFLEKHGQVLSRCHSMSKSLDDILAEIEFMPPRSFAKKYPMWRVARKAETVLGSVELTAGSLAKIGAGAMIAAVLLVGIAPQKAHNTVSLINQKVFGNDEHIGYAELQQGSPDISTEKLSSYVRQFHFTSSANKLSQGRYKYSVLVPEKDFGGRVAGVAARAEESVDSNIRDINFFEFVYNLFFAR